MTFVGTFITGTLLKILTYSCGANPPGATPRLAWSEIVISGQEMYLSRESVLLKTMDVMKRFVFSIGGGGGGRGREEGH